MNFFFYGTLACGHDNPAAALVAEKFGPARRATVQGGLLAVATAQGWYPALVPGRGTVRGWAYRAGPHFGRGELAVLDAWEDCDPRRPHASEYRRRRVPVRLERGGMLLAWCYAWNRPARFAASRIGHGDFARFVGETGLKAFTAD